MTAIYEIEIDEAFHDFAQSAVLRAGYLYPACSFHLKGNVISVETNDDTPPKTIERDIRHLIYREKIYLETLGMRKQLITALTAQ